jgi:putative endonuclease
VQSNAWQSQASLRTLRWQGVAISDVIASLALARRGNLRCHCEPCAGKAWQSQTSLRTLRWQGVAISDVIASLVKQGVAIFFGEIMNKQFYVYIMTNCSNTVLYTGVTNNIVKRSYEHRNKLVTSSFTAKYNVTKLVYYEIFDDVYSAISREKQIKGKSRQKKNDLITTLNSSWLDLYGKIATPL